MADLIFKRVFAQAPLHLNFKRFYELFSPQLPYSDLLLKQYADV